MSTPLPALDPDAPIGVFDSGVGGLSVLDVLRAALPNEDFVYVGDTAHMPYGERPAEQIRQLATGIVDTLVQQHQVKLMVVACNTSAGILHDYWTRAESENACPVPAVEPAGPICTDLAQQVPMRPLGLLATQNTVQSNLYTQALQVVNPEQSLLAIACPGFAKLVEDGEVDTPQGRDQLHSFLEPLVHAEVDAIILGCTHYPFAKAVISELLPADRPIDLLDPAEWMGVAVQNILRDRDIQNSTNTPGEIRYFVTGDPKAFNASAKRLPLKNLANIDAQSIQLLNPV